MEIKIVPGQTFTEFDALETNLTSFESEMRSALRKMRMADAFSSRWRKEGNIYIMDIHYPREGRMKSWLFKKMLKKAIKRMGMDVRIE
jgi:hypothetical protein